MPYRERDGARWLVALPDVAQGEVALEAEVLDVGRSRLTHSQTVEPEEHRPRPRDGVEPLSGEEKASSCPADASKACSGCHVDPAAGDAYGASDAPDEQGGRMCSRIDSASASRSG